MERGRNRSATGSAILVASLLSLGAVAAAGCATTEVSAVTAEHLVIDVRTRFEYDAGHFPGSINIPVGDLEERLDELGDPSRPLIVYCRSGHRSAAAKELLVEAGFTDVLDGGPKRLMMKLAPPEE